MVAKVCRDERRALVTLDLDFSDIRAYPPAKHSGIVILRARTQTIPELLSLCNRMISVLATEELTGHLWIVDEFQIRVRGDDSPP